MIFNRLLKCIDTYSTGCVTECHVFSDDLCVCSWEDTTIIFSWTPLVSYTLFCTMSIVADIRAAASLSALRYSVSCGCLVLLRLSRFIRCLSATEGWTDRDRGKGFVLTYMDGVDRLWGCSNLDSEIG